MGIDLLKIRALFKERPKSRVAIFIRHAEKEISSAKTTTILLNKDAIAQSRIWGENIKGLQVPIKVYSSPELRCVQTAIEISKAVSNLENEIILSNKLGCPGLQVLDNDKFISMYSKYQYRELYLLWRSGYLNEVFRSPTELKQLSKSFIMSSCIDKGITVYVSQSGTVANIGYALKKIVYHVEEGEWVPFLDGFFIEI